MENWKLSHEDKPNCMSVYLDNLSFKRNGEIVRVFEYESMSACDEILESREKIWIWNAGSSTLRQKSGKDVEKVLSRRKKQVDEGDGRKRKRDDLDYAAVQGEDEEEPQRKPVPENKLETSDEFLVSVIGYEDKEGKNKKKIPGPKRRDSTVPLDLKDPANKRYWKNYSSPAWVFFDLKKMVSSDSSIVKLKCRACGKELTYNRGGKSSKELLNHCKKQHEKLFDAVKDIDFRGLDSYYSLENFRVLRNRLEGQATLFQKNVKMVMDEDVVIQFVCWVISANIPLGKFKNKYWAAFKSSCAAKGVSLPGRDTMIRLIDNISLLADITATQSIKESGSVALAIDMWTSLAKDHYMGVTYHWIDASWNLNAQVMELYPFFGSATGKMLAQVIEERFDDRFGDEVTLAGIVSDRGSNVKFARNDLCPYDSEDCVAHLLNTCVGHVVDRSEDGKKTHERFSSSIHADLSHIQMFFVWMKSNEYHLHMLEEAMPRGTNFKKPLLANATRWWGKFRMVERLIYLKEAIMAMLDDPADLQNIRDRVGSQLFLGTKFWLKAQSYKEIFGILNKLSVKSQGEKKETRSRVVSLIHETLDSLEKGLKDCELEVQKACWRPFLSAFKEEIVPVTLVANNSTISHLLSPMNYVKGKDGCWVPSYLDEHLTKTCWEALHEEALDLKKQELSKKYGERKEAHAAATTLAEFNIKDGESTLRKSIKEKAEILSKQSDEKRNAFSLLDFMRNFLDNNDVCEDVVPAVKAFLCIPVSAAGPERLFSDSGRVVTPDRNRIDPSTVSKLCRGRSFLNNPPVEYQSWEGSRNRSKEVHLATVSSETLKKLSASLDVNAEVKKLRDIQEKRWNLKKEKVNESQPVPLEGDLTQ